MHFLSETYLGGLLLIVVGCLGIKLARINQKKADPINNSGLKGWIGGISLILIGLVVLVRMIFNTFK